MRIAYRARQFWQTLTTAPSHEELARIEKVLSPDLLDLFLRMHPSEQAHSIRIYQQVCQEGEQPSDLMVAALLHDIGKTRYPLRLWERVLVVLGRKFFPRFVHEWGQGPPAGWRRAFVVACQHPTWGAEMATKAGASATAVSIIRRHQERLVAPPVNREENMLHLLQLLDNQN